MGQSRQDGGLLRDWRWSAPFSCPWRFLPCVTHDQHARAAPRAGGSRRPRVGCAARSPATRGDGWHAEPAGGGCGCTTSRRRHVPLHRASDGPRHHSRRAAAFGTRVDPRLAESAHGEVRRRTRLHEPGEHPISFVKHDYALGCMTEPIDVVGRTGVPDVESFER